MRVFPDANRVAAALIRPGGWSARQFQREDVTFIVPAYLFAELEAHAAHFAKQAGCTLEVWRARVKDLRTTCTVIPDDELQAVADDPLVAACLDVDPDDAVYVATVLAGDAEFLWTNDHRLWSTFRSFTVRIIP